MQAVLDTPRTIRSRLSELVDRQTALLNADAPEDERVAVFKDIVKLQQLLSSRM